MPARTIDEVLEQLDEVIDRARREKSRLGYFAALDRLPFFVPASMRV